MNVLGDCAQTTSLRWALAESASSEFRQVLGAGPAEVPTPLALTGLQLLARADLRVANLTALKAFEP